MTKDNLSPQAVRRTRRALLELYDREGRSLPWRRPSEGGRPEPYRVWISEVMLQQTRVEAVLPYYRAWMERFPDVGALAGAPLEDVLKRWEGLGYYSRARNLHRAALVVRDRMGGELPRTAAALRALPGVGEYSAGAIASIAFGERVPAVDGNVRRVLARLYDEPEPSPAWLRTRAAALVEGCDRPGDLNQALMELGATVCTPRGPACGSCPLARACAARRAGTVPERPRPRQRAPQRVVEFGVAAVTRRTAGGAEILLTRRPERGLLGGLWEMPTAEVDDGRSALAAAAGAAAALGIALRGRPAELPAVAHVYSHFRGVYKPFVWEADAPDGAARDARWVDRAGLERLALGGVQRRIVEQVMGGPAARRRSRNRS